MANPASDEINLMDLLAGFLSTLKKNLWLSILLPTAGLIAGVLITLTSRDHFESSLLIETSLLSGNECSFLFGQLKKLGTIPGLTKAESKALSSFSFEAHANGAENELNEKSLFIEMTAEVTDKNLFPRLQNALVGFIDKYPSVVRRRGERDKFYNQMIAKIDEEIRLMEAVKKQISANVQATYLNPAELYASSVVLQKEKIQYEIRRDQVKTVHLVKPFENLSTELKPSVLLGAVGGFIVGCALLCVTLFALFVSRYLAVYETTH